MALRAVSAASTPAGQPWPRWCPCLSSGHTCPFLTSIFLLSSAFIAKCSSRCPAKTETNVFWAAARDNISWVSHSVLWQNPWVFSLLCSLLSFRCFRIKPQVTNILQPSHPSSLLGHDFPLALPAIHMPPSQFCDVPKHMQDCMVKRLPFLPLFLKWMLIKDLKAIMQLCLLDLLNLLIPTKIRK